MLGKFSGLKMLGLLLILGAVAFPQEAKAWDYHGRGAHHGRGDHYGRHRNHGHHHYVHRTPAHSGFAFSFSSGPVFVAYKEARPNYVVVRPSTVLVSTPRPTVVVDTTDVYTVHVPNRRGGYNAVTMQPAGDGFIGPQGEYYYNFPTVQQLTIIYGK